MNIKLILFCSASGAATSSSHGVRRNSVADSEISFSVRHVSVESRRNSIDSVKTSVKIAEMKTKVARGRSKSGGGKNHRRGRRSQRRESSTSVESHSRIFNAKTKSNYKRRSASAGLDPMQINALLNNHKLMLPFLQSHGMHSSDDEKDVNSTSVHVKNIDVCLKQQFNNLSDEEDDPDQDILDRIEMNLARNETEHLMSKRMTADNGNNTTDDEKMSLTRCQGPGPPGIDSLSIIKTYMEGAMMMKNGSGDTTASSKNSTKTKNSAKSNRSRKSSRRSRKISATAAQMKMSAKGKELVEMHKEQQTFYSPDYGVSSVSTFDSMDFSNADLMNALGTLHSSSYSGISKNTNSRNSKRSCDVGIQANAHEIVSASGGYRKRGGDEENIPLEKYSGTESSDGEDNNQDQETDCLTAGHVTKIIGTGGGRAHLKKPNREDLIMSESDKLKMLLLPSPKCQAH